MRASREIMGDLATSGMTPEQIALVMELTAAVSAEARPVVDDRSKAAIRQANYRARKANVAINSDRTITENVTNHNKNITNHNISVTDHNENVTTVTESPSLSPSPLPSPKPPTNPPPPYPPGDNPRARKGLLEKLGIELPKAIPIEAWDGFVEMRKSIGKPLKTTRAVNGIISKLRELAADGYPPGAVLDQSTMNSWQSVFELKGNQNGKQNKPTGYAERSGQPSDAMLRASQRFHQRFTDQELAGPDLLQLPDARQNSG